jgi:hypothetical protein
MIIDISLFISLLLSIFYSLIFHYFDIAITPFSPFIHCHYAITLSLAELSHYYAITPLLITP